MFLTRISTSQPVFATMVMVAILVFGLFSFSRLPIEQMPNVDFPVVAVVVAYPGASPEAVEADIVKPIEDAVATIQGLDKTQGIAQPGSAMVIMFFKLEVGSQQAAQDVRDKIAQIAGNLPDNAHDPVTLRFDPSALPVMSLAVSSDTMAERDLTSLTEDVIARRLLNIQGVGSASVVGGVDRQLNFLVDPDRLSAFGISVGEVIGALSAENRNTPAGTIEEEREVQSIQVEGRIDRAQDFLDIIVARRGGQPVRLRDVATLEDGHSAVTSLALLDGTPALAVDVVKAQGANTVEIAHEVRATIDELNADPALEGVHIDIVRDNAKSVENSYNSVQNMLLEGALLATIIVFLFLNSWRSTVITGLTLPISLIGTMSVLYFVGFTLNMMTMMALSLAVGILIDDAIVVRENIMRHLHMGKSHLRAALDGTNEIGLAVLATTLSIVSVFLPVAFMEGIIGRFFLQFGVTVSVAVLISLFVAFTLDPMLSSVWYDPSADPKRKKGPIWKLVNLFDLFFMAVARSYVSLLRWCLKFRKLTLLAVLAALGGSLSLIPLVGLEFMPQTDNGEFQVTVETPVGSSLDYTASKLRQVDTVLHGFPEVARTYATVASGTSTTGNNTAQMLVTMVDRSERIRTPQQMSAPVRTALESIPGITVTVGTASPMGGGSSPVDIAISGPVLQVLEPLSEDLIQRLEAIPGLVDVKSSLELAQPVLGVRIDRDLASDQGVSIMQVGQALSPMLGGEKVGDWTDPQGRVYDLNVQLPEDMRNDTGLLGALPIAISPTGEGMIRLDQVAQIVPSLGASQINRQDGLRTIQVTANLAGITLGDALPQVQAAMAALDLPPGYRITTGGDQQNLSESGGSAASALLLAVIFIYLVLASQFGSFLQPLAIMMSLPLAVTGVLAGLLVGGSSLNIFSMIGFIMLMGLVVKNAILLVDNANQHRRHDGMNLYDALVLAGYTRFRPIIMTTLAMILGMTPLALNLHGGSGENAPMAHAVIGGLISSTLLTLIVVPVVLTYIESFGRFVGRLMPKAPHDDVEDAHA
ncbi:MAG: efflux RND transporter permease subunit [Rubellimicrobium sp.]|nr:efflux RND transporter permease subunit [Rubellimicrobium sp.]